MCIQGSHSHLAHYVPVTQPPLGVKGSSVKTTIDFHYYYFIVIHNKNNYNVSFIFLINMYN